GVVTNIATVSAFELDLNPNNNSGRAITTVNALTDLSIAFQNPPGSGLAGSNVTYTLRVTNYGPSAASSAVVTEPLPVGASFVSATTTQGKIGRASCRES